MDEVFMAVDTSLLSNLAIPRLDLDWIVIVAKCKSERMEEAVIRFGDVFADKVVWQMTVVADSHVMMTAMLPRVVMLLHHMAVRTALRIVAQVAGPFAVAESEGSDSGKQPQHDAERLRSTRQPGKASGVLFR